MVNQTRVDPLMSSEGMGNPLNHWVVEVKNSKRTLQSH